MSLLDIAYAIISPISETLTRLSKALLKTPDEEARHIENKEKKESRSAQETWDHTHEEINKWRRGK